MKLKSNQGPASSQVLAVPRCITECDIAKAGPHIRSGSGQSI